ncbi:hypothetical protein LVB77_09515 [Lysobacter sp. 5GHs7-4]|uniref:hypothetical protein n=1 Tax=Lysobacter sp. 5GHs7-4 TaxID=2904253 RepID=UPI001E52354F|nr:hypothetical protein [Lysobacter sp. 5GHs7-4]UHQ24888.1 hypothetical protein LVB77_09515 [Lysobacter sp. 5GHs7-4]
MPVAVDFAAGILLPAPPNMLRYLWLLALVIPPWAAVEFDAPKWAIAIAAAPFFLYAMSLGDPDEDMLGEHSAAFRKGALTVMAIGGAILGTVAFVLWKVLFPSA